MKGINSVEQPCRFKETQLTTVKLGEVRWFQKPEMDTVSDRLHFIYLMQQNKSVNSSSQWYQRMKSLQGTLDRPEQRGHMEACKEGKEREREKINLVQLKAKRNAHSYKRLQKASGKQSFVVDGAAHPASQTSFWTKLPCVVFLSLSSLVWLFGKILISGGSGLWPARDAMRALRYCRRVTCKTHVHTS